uniref:Uncharacterized protein n=1 Tax=Anguilla anguilla TaxID=7936 RepID=A0A0E9QJ40_ANGAN
MLTAVADSADFFRPKSKLTDLVTTSCHLVIL